MSLFNYPASDAENYQVILAHEEISKILDRLGVEGFDVRIIMAALGSAGTDFVDRHFGRRETSIFFARMSAITMPVAEGD